MAIIPSSSFPGKIDNTDLVNYPQGKAQNITTPGDGTGTPFVADLVNDMMFGFFQYVLTVANITPSGVPDTATDSQYFDGIRAALNTFAGQEIFESDDTFNTPTGVTRIKVTLTGGGGSGGSSSGDGAAHGGGGGATEVYFIDNPDPSYSITIGLGAVGSIGGSGVNGAATDFGTLNASGGGGGASTRAGSAGSGGAVAAIGGIGYGGFPGEMGKVNVGANDGAGGDGGSTFWGGGPRGRGFQESPLTSSAYGHGGAGTFDATVAGGEGGDGVVVVEYNF